LSFLLQTLHRLSIAQMNEAPLETDPNSEGETEVSPPYSTPGALEPTRRGVVDPRVRTIFRIWVVVFGLVGAQMSWILRPFIGDPHKPFTFLRERESHFFEAVAQAFHKLFSW
jgi:hypothetical protein